MSWVRLALEVWGQVKGYLAKLRREKVEDEKREIDRDPVDYYNRRVQPDSDSANDSGDKADV